MNYGNMPLIIPVLATGYLLTIYLLLALAQRTAKETVHSAVVSTPKPIHKHEAPSTPKVTEASSVR